MFGEDDIVKSHKQRVDIMANIIVLFFALVVARLWYLQIYNGKLFFRYSLENRLRKEINLAPRGMIFSRNSELLVHNVPRFDAIVIPQYLKNSEESIAKLAAILDMSVASIKKILKKNSTQASYRPVSIKKNISPQEVAIIETENSKMPGVAVSPFISRMYTDQEIGAHLMGYISEISQAQLPRYRKRDDFNYKLGDFIGQAGLEEQFDLDIRGEDGYQFMEVDAQGRMKKHVQGDGLLKGISNQPPVAGYNLRLSIDRDLQRTAHNAIKDKVAAVVAVDVQTGEVLTMVSTPAFDPAQFSRGFSADYWQKITGDEQNPLRDRVIQEHYPPGSTFKTVTAIAALEEGIVDEKTEVICTGVFRLGKRPIHCWQKHGHGAVDIYRAIRESCDVFFYKIATKLDIDALAKYARMLGLGSKTGITLPRETPGLIPTREWKKKRNGIDWQIGDTISCVIGQGYILATPIQLAMAYATIANGGKLYRPHLIKEVFNNNGDLIKRVSPELLGEAKISQKTWDIVRKGLTQVAQEPRGTAYWYRGQGIELAGKTGTSQVMQFSADKIHSRCEDYEYKMRHHGLFVGYAPYSNPKIAVAVLVEHSCHGASAGAPVAQAVITKYMEKYYPEERRRIIEQEKKESRLGPIHQFAQDALRGFGKLPEIENVPGPSPLSESEGNSDE